MKAGEFFPFSISDYLTVFSYFVIFLLFVFFTSYIAGAYAGAEVLRALSSGAAVGRGLAIAASSLVFLMLNLLAYALLTALAYSLIARRKFSLGLWPKFILSLLLLSAIFAIPFLFSTRLLSENHPAATAVFIIFLALALHFFNLSYLFTAITGKTLQGVKKGFWFGTVKAGHLAVPYAAVVLISAALSFLMGAVPEWRFPNIIISAAFLGWAALYVGRVVLKKAKAPQLTAKMKR